jgi:nicotinamidase/pyrazinamidase
MIKVIKWIGLVLLVIIFMIIANVIFISRSIRIISEGTPVTNYDTEKSALMVIDIQEATTGEVSHYEYFKDISDSLIQKINQIIDTSNDNQILVIYIRNEVTRWLFNIIDNSMAKGSEGAELDPRLKVVNTNIISKEKQDAFSNPQLDILLIDNKINHLYIVGLDAAYCVNSTIDAAINREYKITVIVDGLVSKSDSLKNQMLSEYKDKGVGLVTMEEYFLKLDE